MCMFAWLFCVQPSSAASEETSSEEWSYPSSKPDGKFSGGYGNGDHPYIIKTAQDLADLAWLVNHGEDFENQSFMLDNDIVLNNITFDENNKPTNQSKLKEWTSIGEYGIFLNDPFSGYFYGNGHSISGLYINVNSGKYTGLFGVLDCANVWGLTIKDSYMAGMNSSNYATGMLVGYMKKSVIKNCNIENSHINITVVDKTNIGGIVGQGSGDGKKVVSSSFSGSMTIHYRENTAYVAGIMGLGTPDLTNCRVDGVMRLYSFSQDDSWYEANDKLYANGLCYDAGDITGCVNNMNFEIGTENGERLRWIYMNTLCESVGNISRTVNLGNIKVMSTNGWSGKVSNLGSASSMNDCAFYGSATSQNVKSSVSGKITYSYLGYNVWGFDKKSCHRTVFLEEKNYTFVSDDLERFDCSKDCADPTGYYLVTNTGDKKFVASDDLFAKLNEASTDWNTWGKIKGRGDILDGCPLPVVCGGVLDAGFKGEGTEKSPWLIGSEAELRELADGINKGKIDNNSDKYYVLTADIDMTNSDAFDPIGNAYDHAFCGHFDGQGHVITGIKINDPGLFGYVGDGFSLKRLAVVDAQLNVTNNEYKYSGVLVGRSDAGNTVSVSDCYVGGDIHITANKWFRVGAIFGENGDNISNCYFKGRFVVDKAGQTDDHDLYGIVGFTQAKAVINSCYASFSVEAPSDIKIDEIGGICSGNDNLQNCYSVSDDIKLHTGASSEHFNGKKITDDSKIFDGYEFPADSPWVMGAFRPVLKDVKSYAATAADGTDKEAYYDAIAMANDKSPANDICHYTLKDGEVNDPLLWALPNLAIYNPADKNEYIVNCTLDPTKPFNYSSKTSCKAEAVNANILYPLALETGKHYYPLCLPGTVHKSNFPLGSLLYIGGEVKTDNDGGKYINIAQVDSVAGGIPFVAYIPSSETGETVNLSMRSRMAENTLSSITDGQKTLNFALTGTYQGGSMNDVCNNIVESDNKIYIKKVEGQQTVSPLSAYLIGEENVELRNYLLLDETSNDIAEVIAGNDGKNVNTMLKRALVKGKWNTICLPTTLSSYNIEHLFAEGTKLEQLSSVQVTDDGGCTLVFTKATEIEAGKSYLIMPANDNVVYNLGYCDISDQLAPSEVDFTIDGAAATIKFCGTLERKMLGIDDKDEYFTQDNTIYHVADGQQIAVNGFRCYITANKATAAAMAKARMVHSDGSTTDLRLVEVGSTADGKQRIYNLQGIEQNSDPQQRGVYIKGGRKYVK